MSAKPGAYDDVAAAYAEELSPVHHGLLRVLRRCGDTFVSDRRSNFHPTDQDGGGHPEPAFLEDVEFEFHRDPERKPYVTRTPAQIQQAARNGGAANKARWDKIKAARKLPEAA